MLNTLKPSKLVNGVAWQKLSVLYKGIADKYGLEFMDAADITSPSDVDGVHLSPEGHRKIGQAVAARIADVFRG